ncbi:ROK family protein [Candidatus Wolfebacteria bacterium]|nr:ROK family protein [Candidatus Wolfebacteria bacterium]
MKKTFYLGIDIGGTEIRGILLDSSKNQRFLVFNIVTPRNKKSFLSALNEEINGLTQKKKIIGIGVGLPGIVDVKRGILAKAPNLPFLNGWQAKKFFSKFKTSPVTHPDGRYGARVKIDNDSRCFLRGEAFLGAGKNYKNIVALTIGTGIGGGLMINDKIYYGSHNSAGEFGHMIIGDKKSFERLGAKKAFLKMGDTSKIIGLGIADLINALDPQIVILGGGGIFTGGIQMETVRRTARKYIMSPLAKKASIIKGKLGENAQAIGAALLFKAR